MYKQMCVGINKCVYVLCKIGKNLKFLLSASFSLSLSVLTAAVLINCQIMMSEQIWISSEHISYIIYLRKSIFLRYRINIHTIYERNGQFSRTVLSFYFYFLYNKMFPVSRWNVITLRSFPLQTFRQILPKKTHTRQPRDVENSGIA